jgi:hypothetical protein
LQGLPARQRALAGQLDRRAVGHRVGEGHAQFDHVHARRRQAPHDGERGFQVGVARHDVADEGLAALGRAGGRRCRRCVSCMGFRMGIVGLPNVGKSTLFNALTRTAAAQAANFPFCTIEPNVGEVAVPDPRLEKLAAIAARSRSSRRG